MIDRTEIETKAEEFQIHPVNVERDYVFGWILAGIYTISELRHSLILKGGNCFRKAFFPATRFSHDLDFATETAVDPGHLQLEFEKVCRFAEEGSGVRFEADRTKVELQQEIDQRRKVYGIRVYFKDFYGNPDKFTISVSIDVVEFDRIYLPAQTQMLIHPYSDSPLCRVELRCLKLEELLANKLKCLLQRRHIADLYDLAFSILVNRDVEVNRSEVVTTFLKKTIFEPSPDAAKRLLLDLPLHAMKGVWTKYVICPVESLIDWDRAVEGLRSFVETLFAPYGVSYAAAAYYPSSFGNVIMEAGMNRKLIRLTYDDVSRIVEPYSLVFKRRQDGVGQEYFYVYDRTGGRSSGPGIKSLVHTKIQGLELTEETFEPRCPIELSKAGEWSEKTYFGSPFGGRGVRSPRPRASSRFPRLRVPGWKYTYECYYCNRRFVRSTRSDRLRAHKDKYGNDCYGRRGVFVSQDMS